MSAVRRLAPVAVLAVAASALAATPAAGTDRPTPEYFNVQTRTVQLAGVTSGTPYVTFTVPECVTEIAYIVDGAAGGSSRRVGTNAHAAGGQGALLSGTVHVTAGEQLRLYPSQRGGSAQLDTDYGAAGGGGSIGYSKGGGGSGKDQDYSWPWNIHQNAGGGGGASSAITIGATRVVVAAGGGGAGGSSWNTVMNTAVGGAGDTPGADGVGNPGSGGTVGIGATGVGGTASDPSNSGGGGGGGGAGVSGGNGGRGSTVNAQGGGAGGGGRSFVEPSRDSHGSIAAYGLSASDIDPTGDGTVKIAWTGCASVLTLNGTATDGLGTTTPASGWSHTLSTAATLRPGTDLTLDAGGRADATLRGFANVSATIPVTVSQASQDGWVMRDWTETELNTPLATCIVNGDPATTLPVTNVDARSFRIDVPADAWVSCTFDTVEGAPEMTVEPDTEHVLTGTSNVTTVTSGDDVTFGYTVRNTGNLPLTVTATDPKTPDLACASTALLPGTETRCTGTASITRD